MLFPKKYIPVPYVLRLTPVFKDKDVLTFLFLGDWKIMFALYLFLMRKTKPSSLLVKKLWLIWYRHLCVFGRLLIQLANLVI
jgi:hypothetical protein